MEKFSDDLLPAVKAILQELEIFSYPLSLVSKLSQHGAVSKWKLHFFFLLFFLYFFYFFVFYILLDMNNSGTPS